MTNFLLTSVDAPVQRRACPTSCTASCSGTPFSQSRSSTSSSMFFGLSCILVLMVSYASQICSRTQQRPSKSHQLLTDKLGNLPWSTLFPFWRWSKWWVHSPVLFFFFSHPSHLSSNGMRLPKKEEDELQVYRGNDDNNRFRQPAGRGNCLYSSYSQKKQNDFPVVY